MGKRLVVCCDGTWNTIDKKKDGLDATTNIVRLTKGILAVDTESSGTEFHRAEPESFAGYDVRSRVADAGIRQVVCYCEGVGTRIFNILLGGGFGFGLSRNIKSVYSFLVENYEPGDDIFLFGFSRGAYTVRSLAGLIRNSGILRKECLDRLDEAYALYRKRKTFVPRSVDRFVRGWQQRSRRRNSTAFASRTTTDVLRKWQQYVQYRERRSFHPESEAARSFRERFSREARIHFIGVWDTVGALGIPEVVPLLSRFLNRRWMFHDVSLSSSVDNAFQALSIDERRKPFSPTLWEQQVSARAGGQRLEQVWFAGDHSDVGGGHADSDRGLPELALEWMVEKACQCGLAVDISPRSNPLAKMHDSMSWYYRLLGRKNREITGDGREALHPGVLKRFQAPEEDYSPPNLVEYLAKTSASQEPDWPPGKMRR